MHSWLASSRRAVAVAAGVVCGAALLTACGPDEGPSCDDYAADNADGRVASVMSLITEHDLDPTSNVIAVASIASEIEDFCGIDGLDAALDKPVDATRNGDESIGRAIPSWSDWSEADSDAGADPGSDADAGASTDDADLDEEYVPEVSPEDARVFVLKPDATSDRSLMEAAAAFLEARTGGVASVDTDAETVTVELSTPAGAEGTDLFTNSSGFEIRPAIAVAAPEPFGPEDPGPSNTSSTPSWAGDPDYFLTPEIMMTFATMDCSTGPPSEPVAADVGVVMCAHDGSAKYILGASVLSAANLSTVSVEESGTLLSMDAEGAEAFRALTEKVMESGYGQVALVADGQVVSAPSVATVITDGRVEISGADGDEVQRLAGGVVYGSDLMRLSVQSVAE